MLQEYNEDNNRFISLQLGLLTSSIRSNVMVFLGQIREPRSLRVQLFVDVLICQTGIRINRALKINFELIL